MTEKLKQKFEKRFEKWLRKYLLCNDCKKKCTCIQLNAYCEEQVKQAYIAGATENGIQWHDLRKDPKDLPNDDRIVYVASLSPYEAKENVFDYMFDSWLGDDWFYNAVNEVIAWCENPQFKE